MRKLYLTLIAMTLVCVSAMAQSTFYLRGGMNSWGSPAAWQFKQVSGDDYILENVKIDAGITFKVGDSSWGSINYGGKTNMAVDTDYTLTYNSSNCSLKDNFEGNVKFNLKTHVIRFEGKSTEFDPLSVTAYIRGSMNNWLDNGADDAWKFASTDGNNFLLENVTIPAGSNFKIGDMNWGTVNFGGKKAMEFNKDYVLDYDGTDCTLAGAFTGNVSFVLSTKTIRFISTGPVETDCQVYWDNSEAAWAEVWACVYDADGNELDAFPGNQMEAGPAANVFNYVVPAGFTKIEFSDGTEANKTAQYEVKDQYIYSTTNAGTPYEAPVDYSSWYLNIPGDFNNWNPSGVQFSAEGIATQVLTNVAGNFKVKLWNGQDVWYSNGQTLQLGQTYTITDNIDPGMQLAADAQSGPVRFTFNAKTHELTVEAAVIDYSKYYVNFIGDFNEWADNGVQPNADGVATNRISDVGATGFKVKVWTGEVDIYYSTGAEVAMNEWIKVGGDNEATMKLPAEYQTGTVDVSFNVKTNELRVVPASDAVELIDADSAAAPEYYNLQGIRVAEPASGNLYILRQGNSAVKIRF